MNKFIANYHNGVRFYSKTISLYFPDKITSYKKRMKNKGLVLVLERKQSGFLYMRYVSDLDKEKYLAKPENTVKVTPSSICYFDTK